MLKERGSITKDLPFLNEEVRSVVESILEVTNNYWDFSQALSKVALDPDCHPNLVYLSYYHSSRLRDKETTTKIVDAHPELPLPYPMYLPLGTVYEDDKVLIEKSIELNQNLAITFYMLMRLYRATAIGSTEEEHAKTRIEEFLAENEDMCLHGADYLGHTGWRCIGKPDEVLDYYNKALELARESGDKCHQVGLLTLIAEIASQYKKGKDTYADAKKYLGEAIELSREIGHRAGVASALQTMAVFAYGRGEIGEAYDCQLESAIIQGELGEVDISAAYNLSGIYQEMGDRKSAKEWTRLVEERENEMGPYSWFTKVTSYLEQGNMREAENALEKATKLTMDLGYESALGRLYSITSLFERARGDLESAMDYVERALEIYDRASRQVRVRLCLQNLVKMELELFMPTKQNRMDEFSGKWMKRLEQEVEINDIPGFKARLMLLISELRIRQGRHDEAEQLLDDVISFTDGKTMRFVHKKAVEKREEWVQEGVLPVDTPRQPRER
ncbi:MAG: tetratricopeptide repeat protein [Candidatus Thorarchaeota archaeon]|jgi:tetratricopeptide (TPR) repeat protein